VNVSQFVERLKRIEGLIQVYWSEKVDGIDVVLAMDLAIVAAVCNTASHECRVSVFLSGIEDFAVPQGPSVGDVVKAIFSAAALAHGIAWYAADRLIGSTCPHCNATYSYPQEKFVDGLSVECQNCGKMFDTQQTPTESPPPRGLDEVTKCTLCGAQYVYRESDLDTERTAACRNCGVRIAFPSILDEW
jgi:DNA-directed RNA polymerase subunit RPC12/RpoP